MKKLLKTIFKVFLTLTLVGCSAVFLLIWKMHSEPMTLNKVTSYFLRNHPEVTVTQTQIVWNNITKDPKIEFKDINYTYQNIKLSAPKATITINIWDLLLHEIHLKNLVIQNPKVSIQTYLHSSTSSPIKKIEDILASYQTLLGTLPIDHFELLEGATVIKLFLTAFNTLFLIKNCIIFCLL